MTQRNTFLLFFLLLGLSSWSSASHIVGGNVRLTAKGVPGQYTLSLNLFIDEQNSSAGDIKPTVKLAIYRRRDNLKMGEFELPLLSQKPLAVSNQACAQLRPLKLSEVIYSKDLELDPDRFDDPDGYYVVHGVCCRSGAIDNIQQADESGMVFYLDFPAIKTTTNSSPAFLVPTGEYACLGQPFTFSFKATDADGDQLKYSLVTPYKGFTNQGVAFDNQPSSAYPTVAWKPGFSAASAVPGAPGLSINAETGELSVTANQIGLFAFAVLCEEYRGGKRIGSVRRDFQLAVVDCPTNTPPAPVISVEKAPENAKIGKFNGTVTSVSACQGQSVTLKTESSANWSFQWQRDGQDLEGDTTASILIKESGNYTVVKKFRNTCGKPSPAQTSVRIDLSEAETLKLTASGPTTFCDGKSVILKAPEGNYSYAWFKNDQSLAGTKEPNYQPHETGEYKVQITSAATGCVVTDSMLVKVNPKPQASIRPPALTTACSGDTIRLNAAVVQPTYSYQWSNTGTVLEQETGASLAATQAGHYVLTVTDTNQCQAVSDAVLLTFRTAPTVTMNELPPVCENMGSRLPLMAEPGGGTFAGVGRAASAVAGTEFDPAKTGPGEYVVTYTLTMPGNTCPGRARQTVLVLAAPVISVSDVTVRRGSEVQLNTNSVDTLSYYWTPSVGLSSPVTAQPYASPDTTTTYRVRATSAQNCVAVATLTVTVVTALYIPDAFSPNNDGQNDQWVIRGIDDYPNCTVEVYNRWGNPVFVSKGYQEPWDGRSDGQDLPPAVYQYVIKPGDSQPHRRGTLLLIR